MIFLTKRNKKHLNTEFQLNLVGKNILKILRIFLGEYTAKEVIFPADKEILESEENRKLYVKSHGWVEAGEKKDRGYNWPVDKNEFRFGKREKLIPNEAYYILNPEDSKNT